MSSLRRYAGRAIAGVLILAAVLRVAYVWRYYFLAPDDAYYYFLVARNTVLGHGVSFDTLLPTNGFHPLWFVLILPFFWFFPADPVIPLIFAVALGTLLYLAAGYVIYRLLSDLTKSNAPGVFAAFLFLLNPGGFIFSSNGLESSLAVLALLLFAREAISLRSDLAAGMGRFVRLGFMAGMVGLCRTDGLLLVGMTFLYLVWKRSGTHRLQGPITSGIVSLIVLFPWFLWSYRMVGSAEQVSGRALALINHQYVLDRLGSFDPLGIAAHVFKRAWEALEKTVSYSGFDYYLYLYLAAALVAAYVWRHRSGRAELGRIGFLLAFAGVFFAAHAMVRWVFRPWYITSFVFVLYIFLAMVYHRLPERSAPGAGRWIRPLVWIFTAGVFLHVGTGKMIRRATSDRGIRFERVYEQVAEIRKVDIPPCANPRALYRKGHTDCGMIGYLESFRCRTLIVNLDGSVNNAAYEAMRGEGLIHYILEAELDEIHVRRKMLIPGIMGEGFERYLEPLPNGGFRVLPNGS